MSKFTIACFLALFLLSFMLLSSFTHSPEPLAEKESLQALVSGRQLPQPQEEPYAQFHGVNIDPPRLASVKSVNRVLGTTNATDKRIEVDLTNQRVYAYEGNRKVFDFLVSTGKWAPTPTGTFRIWVKVRSQKMSGGSKALRTYYYLPNVPYVQFFYNNTIAKMRGFSLHGTYWHSNFGHPMSHGCVNMKTEDAAMLFDWTAPPVTNPKSWATYPPEGQLGTEVVIYGTTPKS